MPRAGTHRTLAVAFGNNDLIEHDDGAVTIPGVHLLDSGTWTDSAVQTALYYPLNILQKTAGNWKDTALWSRHLGGAPRDITDKIGTVLNPRAGESGVVGDLHLHGKTERSRSVIAMIRSGDANYVSVEHGGTESWNKTTKRLEATGMEYYGAAVVNRGACATCTIRGNEDGTQETIMEDKLKEQAAIIEALTAQVKTLADGLAEIKTARELEQKEDKPTPATEDAVKELAAKLEKSEARVKALEDAPAPAVTSAGAPAKELGEVETFATIDRENKTITGV